jgi:hypothetical protein
MGQEEAPKAAPFYATRGARSPCDTRARGRRVGAMDKWDMAIELAGERFKNALRMIRSGQSSSPHAFDLGRDETGQMWSILVALGKKEAIDALMAKPVPIEEENDDERRS